MKSLLKRKNNRTSSLKLPQHPEGPPPITPIDPDGSTASHDSNEIYFYNSNDINNQSALDHPSSQPPTTMTASQFMTHSDQTMANKRAEQLSESPHHASTTSGGGLFSFKRGKNCQTKSREGIPIITSSGSDHFSPSAVSSTNNYATDGFYSKSKKVFGGKERPKTRPSAKSSAFGGAPRYDWMDIETTAAIKIQAAYRRLQTQNRLDALGLSTPGMRNRRAQRRARYQSRMSRTVVSADVPFPFNMCGVGLLFGDGTLEDEAVVDTLEKRRADKAKNRYEREDEEKRRFRMRKKESQHLEEGIEVVESFDPDQEETENTEQSNSPGRNRAERVKDKMSKNLRSTKSLSPGNLEERGEDPPEKISPGGSSYGRSTRRMIKNRAKSKMSSKNHYAFDPTDDDDEF